MLLIALLIVCIACHRESVSSSSTIIKIGMPYEEAREILEAKFGQGSKYRATLGPKPDQDYFDYPIKNDFIHGITVTIEATDAKAKIIGIALHIGPKNIQSTTSVAVREIDISQF